MTAITMNSAPASEAQPKEETLEELIRRLAGEAAETPPIPRFAREVKLTHEEFKQKLRALSEWPAAASLPDDFSRADIYDDHD